MGIPTFSYTGKLEEILNFQDLILSQLGLVVFFRVISLVPIVKRRFAYFTATVTFFQAALR